MKIDINKMRIAMAEQSMDAKDLKEIAGIPSGTYDGVIKKKSVRPSTVGRIARALNVPVESILANDEDRQQEKLHMMSEEQLNRKVELLLRYTELCVRLSSFHTLNLEWKPEYDTEIQIIREEMLAIRRQLGMDNGGK